MPKALHRTLLAQAKKKGLGHMVNGKYVLSEHGRAYVYGTLRKMEKHKH